MSHRRAGAAERAEISQEIRRARAAGTPWKTLQQRFGYGRTRLWMLARDAAPADAPTGTVPGAGHADGQ